jgi:large subunit ribosomal protein L9
MKVLLLKDVKGTGVRGEIKDVKDGYGNNFIIKKGFGKLATNAVIKQWEAEEKRKAEAKANEKAKLLSLKDKISKVTVSIKRKVGNNGSLFGAITKDEIAKELKSQKDLEIDKRWLDMKTTKSTGLYELDVKLGFGIHSTLKVDIEVI